MRLLLVFILLLSVRCDSCMFLDCEPAFDSFEFTYVDSNGVDLIGSQKYTVDDIKIYSIDVENDTTFANTYIFSTTSGSAVSVQSTYPSERSFLEMKGIVTDTLDFKFSIQKTKCCGRISKIDQTTLNGILYTGDFPIEIVEKD